MFKEGSCIILHHSVLSVAKGKLTIMFHDRRKKVLQRLLYNFQAVNCVTVMERVN